MQKGATTAAKMALELRFAPRAEDYRLSCRFALEVASRSRLLAVLLGMGRSTLEPTPLNTQRNLTARPYGNDVRPTLQRVCKTAESED